MGRIKKQAIKEDRYTSYDDSKKLTEEDVINSYDFRVACEIIQNKFPWIKECVLDSESFTNPDFKSTIWVDFVIDPIEVMNEKGWKFHSYIPYLYELGRFEKKQLSVVFDISWEEGNDIMTEIRKIYLDVANTKIIPDELKIPRDRVFVGGNFIIPKGFNLKPYRSHPF